MTAAYFFWGRPHRKSDELDKTQRELARLRSEVRRRSSVGSRGQPLQHWRQDIQYSMLAEISRSDDLDQARQRILRLICLGLEVDVGLIWEAPTRGSQLTCLDTVVFDESCKSFAEQTAQRQLGLGEGLAGRVWASGGSRWIEDLSLDTTLDPNRARSETQLRSAFAFAYGYHGRILGVLEFYTQTSRPTDHALLAELELIGNQLGLFFTLRHLEASRARDLALVHDVMDLATMGHWTWSLASKEVYWSDTLYDICGLEPEPYADARASEDAYLGLVHPDDIADLKEARGRCMAGEAATLEHRIVTPDGTEKYVLFRAEPTIQDGQVIEVAGFVQDISQRKRAEIELRESEQRFASSFQSNALPNIIATLDTGEILDANEAFSQAFGYSAGELQGQYIEQSGLWRDSDHRADFIETLKSEHRVRRYPMRGHTKTGQQRDVLLSAQLITLNHELCVIVVCDDVTERKRLEQDVKLAAKAMEQTVESVIITDAEQTIVSTNKAFTDATGHSDADAVGKNLCELLYLPSEKHTIPELNALFETLCIEGQWEGELWSRRTDGDVFPELWSFSLVKDDADRITHFVCVGRDISELKAYQEELEHQAQHDNLTGLANRTLLVDRCDHAIQLAERNDQRLAMLYLDLDHFKEVNDSLGHLAGDTLLREAARRINDCVRTSDTVCRLGGDEFVILLEAIPGRDAALGVGEKLTQSLSKPFQIEGNSLTISTSVGIAFYPEHALNTRTLVNRADQALYLAKSSGRNTVKVFAQAAAEDAANRKG